MLLIYDIDIINVIKYLKSIFQLWEYRNGGDFVINLVCLNLYTFTIYFCNNFTGFFTFIICKLCGLEIKIGWTFSFSVSFPPAMNRVSVLCFTGVTEITVSPSLALFRHLTFYIFSGFLIFLKQIEDIVPGVKKSWSI